MTDPDLAPWIVLGIGAFCLLFAYRRGTDDPAFKYMAVAVLAALLALVLFWTPAPQLSAEPFPVPPVSGPHTAGPASRLPSVPDGAGNSH